MKRYRLYVLDREGRNLRTLVESFDDLASSALWARSVAHEHGKELWQGGWLLLCFSASGEAWLPQPEAGREVHLGPLRQTLRASHERQ